MTFTRRSMPRRCSTMAAFIFVRSRLCIVSRIGNEEEMKNFETLPFSSPDELAKAAAREWLAALEGYPLPSDAPLPSDGRGIKGEGRTESAWEGSVSSSDDLP